MNVVGFLVNDSLEYYSNTEYCLHTTWEVTVREKVLEKDYYVKV